MELILPMALRNHKAFTPWLAEGKTVAKANPVSSAPDNRIIMSFVRAPPSHVHHGGPHTLMEVLYTLTPNPIHTKQALMSELGVQWSEHCLIQVLMPV